MDKMLPLGRYSIFNTSAGISRKAGALFIVKGGGGFDEANGSNGD